MTITRNPAPRTAAERQAILDSPVFGGSFTDHMVAMSWSDGEWGPLQLVPFGPLSLSPATLVLHYGQSIFEALKAYRLADGDVALFRPDRNADRMDSSARRIAMPELPEGAFVQACELLVNADREWVSGVDGAALYLRPFMFASEPHLAVRPANEYQFLVIASPVASYFGDHLGAISVAVEHQDVRATHGGTGTAKFAGNYAAGFAAHARAGLAGHDQVLWLDAVDHRWTEELNAMNVVFVWGRDGRTVVTTPQLTGTILEGVTRDSLLTIAADMAATHDSGIDVVLAEPTSIEHLRAGAEHGTLREAFACGTAAVVAPIGRFALDGHDLVLGDGHPGTVTVELRRRLLDIQYGRVPDPHGWVHRVRGD